MVDTVNSVLDQAYPSLTYIVQDGGSEDATPRLMEPFKSRVTFNMAKDGGQANAINLGFSGVDVDIMAYLNSDDILAPGSLAYVAAYFASHPTVDMVYGHRMVIDSLGDEIGRWIIPCHDNEILKWVDYIPQETLFWRKRVWDRLKAFDNSFVYALDWDFILGLRPQDFASNACLVFSAASGSTTSRKRPCLAKSARRKCGDCEKNT